MPLDFQKRALIGVSRRVSGLVLFGLCGLLTQSVRAQQRPITARDFDTWRSISGPTLSRDGQYLAYGTFPQEGDGEVIVRDLKSDKDLLHVPAGELPPPPVDDPNAEGPPPPRAIKLSFSQDGKTLVFLAYANHSAVQKAKADKHGPAHEELVIVDLPAAPAARVADVKSFQIPEKGEGLLAYQKYGPPAPGRVGAASEPAKGQEAEATPSAGRAAEGSATHTSQFGSELVLRRINAPAAERQFPDGRAWRSSSTTS